MNCAIRPEFLKDFCREKALTREECAQAIGIVRRTLSSNCLQISSQKRIRKFFSKFGYGVQDVFYYVDGGKKNEKSTNA